MKRIITSLALSAAAMLSLSALAFAVPSPTTVVFHTRFFDDCPISILSTTNTYPASVVIADENPGSQPQCAGFANYHNWRFSEDGTTDAQFANNDTYEYSCDLVLDGAGNGEGGLGMGPWWSSNDPGQFNVRTTDGEVACFGGTMPFYTFTGNNGIHYVKGTTIGLTITYNPRENSATAPGQIIYKLHYNGNDYSSGPLNFGPRNPADPPHGDWGSQEPTVNGGQIKMFVPSGAPHGITATWSNIQYTTQPTPAQASSWGRIKALYR